MSSISNLPTGGASGAQYTDKQKEVLAKLESAAQNRGSVAATGKKEDVKKADAQLKDLFQQASRSGISKQDLKNIQGQTHQDAVASFLGAQKKAGKPIDDKAAAATLHNDYDGYAKQHGLDAKKSETFNRWKAEISPRLQSAGLSDEEVDKSLTAAQKFRFTDSGSVTGSLQRAQIRV